MRNEIKSRISLEKRKSDIPVYIRLSSILGFTWLFAILANIEELYWMALLNSLFGSLQGVYVLVAFGINQQSRNLWRNKLGIKSNKIIPASCSIELKEQPNPIETNDHGKHLTAVLSS